MIRSPGPPPACDPPIVLCLGGHDPTGGAGLIADAEAIRAGGAHALGIVTCLTTQSTCGLSRLLPQPAEQIEGQWQALTGDSAVAAVKIGLLGDAAIARVVASLLREQADLPVVLDPVLASGAGQAVADAALIECLRDDLLGGCSLMTPNLPEARALSGADSPDACAATLLETGCRWVLITGTHDETSAVINRLYGQDGLLETWHWPRLPGSFHGSGCTLASAAAARLAKGATMIEAVAEAQAYTWETLAKARRTGRCQLTPNRLFALERRSER